MSEYDPYRPPQASLLDEHLPPSFVGGNWSRDQLLLLGALALGFALGLFVLLALSLWQAMHPQFPPLVFTHLLRLLLVPLWAYLLLRLRTLLANRFGLHDGLDRALWLQVALAFLATGFAALSEEYAARRPPWLELGSFALFVVLGLCLLRFALSLRRIPRPYPALRLFSWLLLLAGIACATVVLLVPALLLCLAAGAALAWVFFAAAAELAAQPMKKPA